MNCIIYSTVFRQDICRRMSTYETSYKRQHDSTILALYCHWFMSLLAFCECISRYLIHLCGIIVISLCFYVFVCITCGKSTVSIRTLLDTQWRLFGLYWGLSCGIMWNICTFLVIYLYLAYNHFIHVTIHIVVRPWNPPLYAFHVINLTRY